MTPKQKVQMIEAYIERGKAIKKKQEELATLTELQENEAKAILEILTIDNVRISWNELTTGTLFVTLLTTIHPNEEKTK